MIKDLIGQLPKDKRADMRNRFYTMAQAQKNEQLMKTIKEAA
jgi:hypothetical protein